MEVTTQHLRLAREHAGDLQEDCGVLPVEYDPFYPVVIAKLHKNQHLKLTAIAKTIVSKRSARKTPVPPPSSSHPLPHLGDPPDTA